MYSHHLHVHGCCLGTSWTRSSGSSGSPLQELSVSGRRSTVGGGDVVPGQQQLVLVSSRKLFAPESSFLRCSASSSTTSSSGAPSSSSPPPAPAPAPAPVVSDNAKKISSRTQKIMEKLVGAAGGNQAGGAGGASSYEALKKLDQQWLQMRSMTTTAQGTHTHTHLLAAKASWTKQASQQSLNFLFLFLFLILFSFFFFFTHVNLSLGKVLTPRTDGSLDC
jgi:hypothetical protein